MHKKLLLATASTLLVMQAYANENGFIEAGEMASKANLVFRGTVVDVDYRGSKGKGNNSSVPHTFVTYEVEQVLHGNANRKKFTLRFLGGKNGKKKGQVMMVSKHPQFDVGDQDVLFVKGNGAKECPLVDCAGGRFRVVDGMMYTEFGQAIVQDEKGNIFAGKTMDLEQINSFNIGDQTFYRRHSSDLSQDGNSATSFSEDVISNHMDIAYFTNVVSSKIAEALPNDPHGRNKRTKSQDKNKSFFKAQGKPVTLPEPSHKDSTAKKMSDRDRFEVEAMEKNGGNPVIK